MADAWTRAESALEKGDREAALVALLEAWREKRAPALAELIETVSADAARGRPALDEGKDLHERWMKIEAEGSAADVARLSPGLWSEPTGTLGLRLERLVARGADPRTGRALLGMVEAIPTTSSSNFPIWTRAFKAMPEMLDAADAKTLAAYRKRKPKTTSQFWPKFHGWIDKLVESLPDPVSLDATESKRVAKMLARAKVLAKEAPAAAKPAAATKTKGGTKTAGDPLEALGVAKEAIAAKDFATALESLRQAWELAPGPELAGLLDEVSKAAPQETLPNEPPKAVQAAWLALEAKGRASDIPALLGHVDVGPFADIESRLGRLLARPSDPRVATHARHLIHEGKAGGEKRVFWTAVFDLVARAGDAKDLELVTRLGANEPAVIDRGNLTFGNGPLLRKNGARVAPLLREWLETKRTAPNPADLKRAIAAVRGSVPKQRATPEAAMIAEIVAARADDDGPRLVYADWLTENRDRLGELIVVQCKLAAGGVPADEAKKLLPREKALLKARADILGPLADLIWKGSERFERGMLVAIQPELKSERLRRLLDHPRLATVREIDLAWVSEGQAAGLVTHPGLMSLRKVGRVETKDLVEICRHDRPLAIEDLEIGIDEGALDEAERNAIAAAASLRTLRVLRTTFWGGTGVMPAWMMAGDIYGRVERVEIGFSSSGQCPDVAGWLLAMGTRRKNPPIQLGWAHGEATIENGVVHATLRNQQLEPSWGRALRAARPLAEVVLEGDWPKAARKAVLE